MSHGFQFQNAASETPRIVSTTSTEIASTPKRPRLAEAVAAAELQDHRDEDVVHRDEGDAGGEPGDREARVRVRDQPGAVAWTRSATPHAASASSV